MHRRFGRLNRERVHHLDGGRNDATADDVRHRQAACVDRVECRKQRLDGLGPAEDSHGDARHDGQRPFRSDDQPDEIGAGRVDERSADVRGLPVRQDRLDREHVMSGEPVFQTVGAARIFGDVPADRAHLLARGIGRVVVAERRDLTRDLEVGDARLDGHPLIRDIDAQNAIEPRQRDHHAARDGQRAAGQSGAVAASDERHLLARAQSHDGLHLGRRRGQHDGRRHRAQVRQRVALVGQQLERIVEHVAIADNSPQLVEKGAIHVHCFVTYFSYVGANL